MHFKAFVLVLLTICFSNLFAQKIDWLDTSVVIHDRINDLKWHEVFISTEDSLHIKIDSATPGIKGFIVPSDADFSIAHGRTQKKIIIGPGDYHLFIFHSFIEPVSTGKQFLTFNADTMCLEYQLREAQGNLDQHPLDNPTVHVFPKVSSGLFKIDMAPYRNAEVIVYDNLRSIVHETDWNGRLLDLRGLKNGQYYIQVNDEEFPVKIQNIGSKKELH